MRVPKPSSPIPKERSFATNQRFVSYQPRPKAWVYVADPLQAIGLLHRTLIGGLSLILRRRSKGIWSRLLRVFVTGVLFDRRPFCLTIPDRKSTRLNSSH